MKDFMKRFEQVIGAAVKEAMSDVYITGGHPMVSRKHGTIQFHASVKWTHQEVDSLVAAFLSARQKEELRTRKSVDYAISIGHARLRINFFTTTRGLSLAVRILPGHVPTIDELNLHPSLHEIAKLTSGLVLICGATGVGKTTTIASIINEINRSRQVHIVTLENPIEYRLQSHNAFVQQRELGAHMPSFEQGLLDVLRENPDVIVVGELREAETMRLTLNAAESGHLVIATLHASNPEEAIYRLCNSVPMEAQNEVRFQLASTLSWLVVQQLVHMEKAGFRVPLLTIVRGTPSVRNIIRENKLHQLNSAIQIGKSEGMFAAERYISDYLDTRVGFIPYAKTFRPSEEAAGDMLYESPLTDDSAEAAPAKKAGATEAPPIRVRSSYSSEEVEQMLTIEDDVSLQELLKKLEE
jgi:pilus retraction protein PilT